MVETLMFDPSGDLISSIMPSMTYKLDIDNQTIGGVIDGLEAVVQAVVLQLYTQRYLYEIYPANYGSELNSLIGKSFGIIKADLPRVVRDACLRDDRVSDAIVYNIEKVGLDSVAFNVDVFSAYGNFTLEGVELNLDS